MASITYAFGPLKVVNSFDRNPFDNRCRSFPIGHIPNNMPTIPIRQPRAWVNKAFWQFRSEINSAVMAMHRLEQMALKKGGIGIKVYVYSEEQLLRDDYLTQCRRTAENIENFLSNWLEYLELQEFKIFSDELYKLEKSIIQATEIIRSRQMNKVEIFVAALRAAIMMAGPVARSVVRSNGHPVMLLPR